MNDAGTFTEFKTCSCSLPSELSESVGVKPGANQFHHTPDATSVYSDEVSDDIGKELAVDLVALGPTMVGTYPLSLRHVAHLKLQILAAQKGNGSRNTRIHPYDELRFQKRAPSPFRAGVRGRENSVVLRSAGNAFKYRRVAFPSCWSNRSMKTAMSLPLFLAHIVRKHGRQYIRLRFER